MTPTPLARRLAAARRARTQVRDAAHGTPRLHRRPPANLSRAVEALRKHRSA
jgi:hypothetical protein